MGNKVKVHIKSLDYAPRGNAATYRAGSVQILDEAEALELEEAGIAIIVENPFEVVQSNDIPYLEPEKIQEEESQTPTNEGNGDSDSEGDEQPSEDPNSPEEQSDGEEGSEEETIEEEEIK